jgi:hypothetical protein
MKHLGGIGIAWFMLSGYLIHPKDIYFPEHFCCCFSSNLCVWNTTNTD